jgi:hypothetical protein
MSAVLLWKEYRHQRAIWLAIAVLAVLLVVGLGAVLGQGDGLQAFQDSQVRQTLIYVVCCLALSHGVVVGAGLLAGEKEGGTLLFLDTLAGQRGPVWERKLVAGVLLSTAQGLALAALAIGLGFGSWEMPFLLVLLSLDGLAWGLLGGSLYGNTLGAALAASVFMGASWLPAAVLPFAAVAIPTKLGLGLLAVVGSRRIFCRDDRSRRTVRVRRVSPTSEPAVTAPGAWRVLLWLAGRQGRWVLLGCLLWALAVGGAANANLLGVWPTGTLVLGVACGLAVFLPDQQDGSRLLGAQRLPAGRVWTAKVLFWSAALAGLVLLAWGLSLLLLQINSSHSQGDANESWSSRWLGNPELAEVVPAGLFLVLWPLYGFCFGVLFGQLAKRTVIAATLALWTALPVVALWAPSLALGGLSLWQVLPVPVLLLVTSRLAMRPWVSDRLLTRRPLASLVGAGALMVLALAGGLWYRAVEVPDVGEPFDVAAFRASLPPPEKNEAGRLFRSAVAGQKERQAEVEKAFRPPTAQVGAEEPGDQPEAMTAAPPLGRQLDDVLQEGWSRRHVLLGRMLDQVFESTWVQEAEQTARLPLGLVVDPRLAGPSADLWTTARDAIAMAHLFTARALQLQARGDADGALKQLETALGLARQLENNAPAEIFKAGLAVESTALNAFQHWVWRAGPDEQRLRQGLSLLQRHEAALPDPAGAVKAEYLIDRRGSGPLRHGNTVLNRLVTIAGQLPWEKERQARLQRAVAAGALRMVQGSAWRDLLMKQEPGGPRDGRIDMASRLGLPPADGPGASLSVRRWGEFVQQSWAYNDIVGQVFFLPQMAARRLQSLRAMETVAAVALYEARHGGPPATLPALVPGVLRELPINPMSGQPFLYRLSEGETIEDFVVPLDLVPGQALVWRDDWRAGKEYYPVPLWQR